MSNVSGLRSNFYKFIEPNISVSIDSNYFRVAQRYSSRYYGYESYDFIYRKDTSNKVIVNIGSDYPEKKASQSNMEKTMLFSLDKMKGIDNASFTIVGIDTAVRHIKGFSFIGYVGYDKMKQQYTTTIIGIHLSAIDKTEVKYSSNSNDLNGGYKILTTFLKNFRIYSTQEIEKEKKQLQAKYTIIVKPTEDSGYYDPVSKTFLGYVSIQQPLKHQIVEVRLTESSTEQLIYDKVENGKVLIMSNDKKLGKVTKKGELLLINSFGKQLLLPFTFSYINNGQL